MFGLDFNAGERQEAKVFHCGEFMYNTVRRMRLLHKEKNTGFPFAYMRTPFVFRAGVLRIYKC